MTGAEKIIERILQEAREQANAIVAETQQECAQIAAQGKEQAQTQAQALLAKSKVDAVESVRRMKAVAELDARKNVLAAKQTVISEAFDAAHKQLLAMPRPAYAQLMKQVVVAQATSGDIIRPAKADADVFTAEFVADVNKALGEGKQVKLGRPLELSGGCVLQSGAMERNCSIDALLRIVREQQEAQVAAILFA